MITIETVDSYEGFRELAPVWNGILARSDTDVPFMSFEWYSAWWETFGAGRSMRILLARDGGEIVAIAPLMRGVLRVHGLPLPVVTFIDDYYSSRTGFIIARDDPAIAAALFDEVWRIVPRHGLLFLNSVDRASLTGRYIAGTLRSRGLAHEEIPESLSPYVPLRSTWEEYYGSLAKNLRRNFRTFENRLEKLGGFEISVYTEESDVRQAMEEVLAVSRGTWKFGAGTAIANRPEKVRFFTAAAEKAAAAGFLKIRVMKVGGRPVAFIYNFERGGKAWCMKVGYDEEFRKAAPLKVLLREMMRELFETGFTEFDFTGKFDEYKKEWTSLYRETCKYFVYNDNLFGRALYRARSLLRRRDTAASADRGTGPLPDAD